MANLQTEASYTPVSPYDARSWFTGNTSKQYVVTMSDVTQYGLMTWKTGAGRQTPILFCHGGVPGADNLTDKLFVDTLMQISNADLTGIGGQNGYFIMAPDYQQGAAPWNGAPPAAPAGGTDEFGGAEVEDVISSFSLMLEDDTRVDDTTTGVIGFSRGCLMAAKSLREGMKADFCILRAPYCNILDWDNVELSTKTSISTAIPGFRTGGNMPTTTKELNDLEESELRDRSVQYWTEYLPDIPYLILHAEKDAKVPRNWISSLVRSMKKSGLDVTLRQIPGAQHDFTGTTGEAQAGLKTMLSFVAKHT